MSAVYKKIRQAKELTEILQSQGKSFTNISKEIGINRILHKEIMEFDPVAVSIREPSVKKLEKFIEKYGHLLNGKPKDSAESAEKQPMSEARAIEKPVRSGSMPTGNYDPEMLRKLSTLINQFQDMGYRLDVNISRIYTPQP